MRADHKNEQTADFSVRARTIIEEHGLAPHPEGGYFGDCPLARRPSTDVGKGGTCIYYLMVAGRAMGSRLHRLWDQVEVWRYLEGDPVELLNFAPAGPPRLSLLGSDPGQTRRVSIPDGDWQGARVSPLQEAPALGYSLVICSVTPTYDGEKFEMATADQLLGFIHQYEDDLRVNGVLLHLLGDL